MHTPDMARKKRRRGKNEKPSEKSPQKRLRTPSKSGEEANLIEDVSEDLIFEATENFTDDSYDIVKQQIMRGKSPENVLPPVIPPIKIKQEPIDYDEYEITDQNSIDISLCPTSSAAKVSPFIPVKIKEEPKSDDEDTISTETYEYIMQKDGCTNSTLNESTAIPCTNGIKQEKLDDVRESIAAAPQTTPEPFNKENVHVPLSVKIKEEPKNEDYRPCSEARCASPSRGVQLSTSENASRVTNSALAASENAGLVINSAPAASDNAGLVVNSVNAASENADLGINSAPTASDNAGLVTNSNCAESATNTSQIDEKKVDSITFHKLSLFENKNTPKHVTPNEDVTSQVAPPVNIPDDNALDVRIKKEKIETFDCSVTNISKLIDNCVKLVTEIKEENSSKESVVTETLDHVTDNIEPVLKPIKQEPVDEPPSCTENNTQESNNKGPNLTSSMISTTDSQCHHPSLSVDSKSEISSTAHNNIISHSERCVPASVCKEEPTVSDSIPVKPEIAESVIQMPVISYKDSLSSLGSKWVDPVILCETRHSTNCNDSFDIKNSIPASVEELNMYLSLNCNIDSADIEFHATVVRDHLIKEKKCIDLKLKCHVPKNLPLPKELQSALKPRSLENRGTDLNHHLENSPHITETASSYKDVAVKSRSPEVQEDNSSQVKEKINHHALPIQSPEKIPSPANCVSIETLRNIVNTFNLGSVSSSPQVLNSTPIASPVLTSDSFAPSHHMTESIAKSCITASSHTEACVSLEQESKKPVPESLFSNAMLQNILKSTSAPYVKPQEQTTVGKSEISFASSASHHEPDVVQPEDKRCAENIPEPTPVASITQSDNDNDELSDSHDADVNDDAASVGSNDSAETIVNFPCEKKGEDASELPSNKGNLTTDNVESPKKVKSRYEMIMERKQQTEVSKTTKRPYDDDVEHQIKDPRLANLCKKFRQTSKKPIPVITPLPLENTQKKSKGIKKTETEVNLDDNSKTSKISVVAKRPSGKLDNDQNTSNEDGLRSGERFHYRGGFLAKDICQQPAEKKSRLSKSVNQNKSQMSHRSQTPNIEELHATIDVSGILNSRLESNIKYTKNVVSSENLQYSNFQTNTPANYTHPYPSYSTPNVHRDPRLNRTRSVVGDNVNSVNWGQPSSLLGPSVLSQVSGSSSMGVNAPHSQPVKVVTDWNHGNLSVSPVQYPMQQQSSQRVSGYSVNPSLLPTSFHSFQQPVYEAPDTDFVPPLPPNEPVQPPLPSPVYSDSSDMSPSAHSERPLLVTPPQSSSTHNLGRQPVPHNSTVRDNSFFNPPKAPNHFHTARKDVSLLPAPLKNSVGIKIMTSTEVLIIMLSWCVSWLAEQGKCSDPPPICAAIKTVTWRYPDFKEYFNTYLPLLLVETWQRIQHEWTKMIKQHHQGFNFHIEDMKAKGDMIEIECLSKIRKDPTHPTEGYLVILRFSDQQENIKIFGYVASHVYTAGDCVSQSPLPNPDQELHLCIKIIYRLQSSFMKQQVRIHPIYNIKSPLCQVDALRGIDLSPLYRTILHPNTPECDRVVLERVKTTSPMSVQRAVTQIMSSLGLGDSEPRMTIVDSPFGTDQLTILIALIEHVKSIASSDGNTRILVCTRGITRLREIGIQLIPSPDADVTEAIRTVILAKPEAVSHPELKKLSLVEVVSSHMKYLKEQTGEPSEVDSDAYSKVLKTCDVLLSIVTNCHESSIHQILGPKSDTPIKFCILDEAHMCTEPETLVPMLYGIKKFVFFGDPQIKPNARTRLAKENGFKQSLVARLCKALGQKQPAN